MKSADRPELHLKRTLTPPDDFGLDLTRPHGPATRMGEVFQSTRLFLTMKTRIALNTDAKSIRVTNDRFAELT
jgi:hypothetical protein